MCRDAEALAACQAESVSGAGVVSDACFAQIMQYGTAVASCEVDKIKASRISNKNSLVTEQCKADLACVGKPVANQNSLSAAAQLVIFDAMNSQNQSMLSFPDAFADKVLAPVYAMGKARTVLLSFTCADTWWAHRMELFAYSAEYTIAGNTQVLAQPSICNRYTSQTREIDEFVAEHPDLVIIVAAGDGGVDPRSVAAPGTCKNCLTVGAVQSWSAAAEAAMEFVPSVCRDFNCPQESQAAQDAESKSAGEACFLPPQTTPASVADCCRAKYTELNYRPDRCERVRVSE